MNQTPADAGFSLAAGGPLYRLMLKAHLIAPSMELLGRRVVLFTAIAWLPLLVLSLIEGRATSGVAIPFFYDVETHVRLLVALPLLLVAEVVMHRRVGEMVPQFVHRGIVTPDAMPDFDHAVASAARLRDSVGAELLMLALVAAATWFATQQASFMPASAWYADVDSGDVRITRAGWWGVHVSVPLSQFLLFRLYYRLFVWGRFLHQVSRLPLHLVPAHPDRTGGLGFLDGTIAAFTTVVLAHAITVSGWIASRVLFDGRDVHHFLPEMVMMVALLTVVVLLPMCQFASRLIASQRGGLSAYGVLAASYARGFDRKWIQAGATRDEPLLGNADIQSLADMAGSYDIVRAMQSVPFDRRGLLQVLAAVAMPFLPLVLTVMSPIVLMKRLAEVLL